MAHRNSKPKTNASERTKHRHRLRHNTSTEYDKKRSAITSMVKKVVQSQKPNFEKVKITREQVESLAKQKKNN